MLVYTFSFVYVPLWNISFISCVGNRYNEVVTRTGLCDEGLALVGLTVILRACWSLLGLLRWDGAWAVCFMCKRECLRTSLFTGFRFHLLGTLFPFKAESFSSY